MLPSYIMCRGKGFSSLKYCVTLDICIFVYVCICVCVSGSAICGRRMSLFLLYAFRVFIIFSRLLINCNADHNNSIHKYGWEYASRFFYTSLRLRAPNDKWILFSDAKQIGTQSVKCGNSVCCWYFFPFFRRVSTYVVLKSISLTIYTWKCMKNEMRTPSIWPEIGFGQILCQPANLTAWLPDCQSVWHVRVQNLYHHTQIYLGVCK